MFDWLGLSPVLTRILGWIFIACAVVLTALLIYYSIILRKEIKKQKKVALIENEIVKTTENIAQSESTQQTQNLTKVETPIAFNNAEIKQNIAKIKDKEQKVEGSFKTEKLAQETPVLEHKMPAKISEHIASEKLKHKSKSSKSKIKSPERPKRKRNNIKRSRAKIILPKNEIQKINLSSILEIRTEEIKKETIASPYVERLKKLSTEQKHYYEEIKNYLCSYPAIINSIAKDYETFKLNRRVIAKLSIKNSKLILILKVSKEELEKNIGDEVKVDKNAPVQLVFEDELELRKGLNSIESLATENEIETTDKYKPRTFNKLINF